jgi:O-antigen ligase
VTAYFVGFAAALFLLVGRWTPARLLQGDLAISGATRMIALALLLGAIGLRSPAHRARWTSLSAPLLFSVSFLFYFMSSLIWAPHPSLAVNKVTEIAIVLAGTVLFRRAFADAQSDVERRAFWFTVVAVGIALGSAGLLAGSLEAGRMATLGGGPNVFGRNMGLTFLGAIYVSRTRSRKLVWYSIAALAALLLVLSGSRGVYVAAAVALPVLFWAEGIGVKTTIRALLIAIGCWVLIAATPLGNLLRITYDTRVTQLTFQQRYTSGRESLFTRAIELGLSQPLTGAGVAAYRNLYDDYPHNIVLEAFSETGAIGVLLLACAVATGLRLIVLHRRVLDPSAVAAFAFLLATSQFSGDIFDSRGVFFLLMLATVPVRGGNWAKFTSVVRRYRRQGSQHASGSCLYQHSGLIPQ